MTAPTSLSAGPAGPTRLPVSAPCVTAQHPGAVAQGDDVPGRVSQRQHRPTGTEGLQPDCCLRDSSRPVSGARLRAPQSGHLLSPRRTPHPPPPHRGPAGSAQKERLQVATRGVPGPLLDARGHACSAWRPRPKGYLASVCFSASPLPAGVPGSHLQPESGLPICSPHSSQGPAECGSRHVPPLLETPPARRTSSCSGPLWFPKADRLF